MTPNKMKARLARGEAAIGCSVMFPSPHVVEMLGYAGFDWVLLDCEHGSLGLADVEVMCMAATAADITPIARPKSSAPADIQAVLDRGAQGVQIPHINCGDDARRAVDAVKFGPRSLRGLAAGTRPDRWGLGAKMADFAMSANAQSLVCVQIEHEEGVRNIDEILSVDGIDVFFVGPSDLSQSMGFPGQPSAAPVARAIEDTLKKIVAAGKCPGMPAAGDAVGAVRAQGCRYIYTHFPKLIGAGAQGFLAAARNASTA